MVDTSVDPITDESDLEGMLVRDARPIAFSTPVSRKRRRSVFHTAFTCTCIIVFTH